MARKWLVPTIAAFCAGAALATFFARNLAHAQAEACALREQQELAAIRQLAGQRNFLLAQFHQVTVLYEPCSLQVAGGLAAIQPGALLTAAGVPQCAAWAIHGVDVRRWGAQQGGLVLRTDEGGHPLGPAEPATRMPGYQP